MLRVSKLTDYATVVMTALAEAPDAVASAQALAERARLEVPTVSKLLKQLAHAGLIESFRGVNGGYRLARSAASISVAEIVIAMEGPIGMTECGAQPGRCDHESHCGVRGNWQRINQAIEQALRGVSLADMARPASGRRRAPLPLSVTLA
jgi:FeS assembly SUF system regulator